MHQRVELRIPSDLVFERVVRASAAEIGEAAGFPPERIEDLKVALSEAVTNAIEHGNQLQSSKLVDVTFHMDADHLEVIIKDQGQGIGKEVDPSPHMVEEQNLDEGKLRSFGMYLIHALVDHVEIKDTPEGTIVILRFYRKEEASA